MELRTLGEFGLIERLSQRLQLRPGTLLGIGDDAALLAALAAPLVTCDALVEGVHFRRDWISARALGRKAMAVNVSDIVACGGRPVAAVVALALPVTTDPQWLDELYAGFDEAAARYGFTVAGGDTTATEGPLLIAVTLIGEVEGAAGPVLRSGARDGDVLLVTGTLGDAAAGLALLARGAATPLPGRDEEQFLLERHREPVVRQAQMRAALGVAGADGQPAVHAALDLSDGLQGDAAHIARSSGLSLLLATAHLPISGACRKAAAALGADATAWALLGGEDYELLLCVAPEAADAVAAAIGSAGGSAEAAAVRATVVGRCVAVREGPVMLVSAQNEERAAQGGAFVHF